MPAGPPPYRDLCTYVRLDFKNRNLEIPFARPYSLNKAPSIYHEEMKYQIEKTRPALGPDQTLISIGKDDAAKYGTVDGQSEELKGLYLHPYLRGTPTYSADIRGKSDDSDFFKSNDAQTQKCKKMMESWLAAGDKVPATKEQEANIQKMKDFASKNGLTRTHDHARLDFADIKGDPAKKSEFEHIIDAIRDNISFDLHVQPLM
ncbi:uncharacterized protein N7477_009718 [Penicillium maclennaniae]|uniref:uncharacterized protein n=1 Tax=Penicillium maclennaniae TaxID=1343394 RepID=UPI00254025FA|nr:uncharacterized protein N7477_009718 [Penicillium maclennaniae]KAJ5662102.1 hypothetical protein N7477_009718 [Penicillium maclennaniae]